MFQLVGMTITPSIDLARKLCGLVFSQCTKEYFIRFYPFSTTEMKNKRWTAALLGKTSVYCSLTCRKLAKFVGKNTHTHEFPTAILGNDITGSPMEQLTKRPQDLLVKI